MRQLYDEPDQIELREYGSEKSTEKAQNAPESSEISSEKKDESSSIAQNSQGSSEKGSEKRPRSSVKILSMMAENPHITTAELSRILKITDRAVAKHLQNLQAKGLIKRIGPDKGGEWVVLK